MEKDINVYDQILLDLPAEVKKELAMIVTEYRHACEKHPYWPADFIHAGAIVDEEAGELTQATLQQHYEGGSFSQMHAEAYQVGAMALRFLVNASGWWCTACQRMVYAEDVTIDKRHDGEMGGCGFHVS